MLVYVTSQHAFTPIHFFAPIPVTLGQQRHQVQKLFSLQTNTVLVIVVLVIVVVFLDTVQFIPSFIAVSILMVPSSIALFALPLTVNFCSSLQWKRACWTGSESSKGDLHLAQFVSLYMFIVHWAIETFTSLPALTVMVPMPWGKAMLRSCGGQWRSGRQLLMLSQTSSLVNFC